MNSEEKSNWEFPVFIPKNPLKKFFKNSIGKIAQFLDPTIKKELLEGKTPKNKLERAALTSIFIELHDKNLHNELADLHRKIWTSSDNQGYYDFTSNRLRDMFNLLKEPIYTTISNLIEQNEYQELIELGCGEGIIVNGLSEEFPQIKSFIGMDINKAQMEINKSTYGANTKLKFFAGDISENIDLIKGPNKIFLSFGGVLEYLNEKELLFLFNELSSIKNIVFLLYEPIEPGFNYKEEKKSILYGSEFSFCHPYYSYLSENGFDIIGEKLINSDGTSWIFLAAKVK